MMDGAKAHYDGIVAFSQTDFTEDLKKITIPVLVMHSEDDQIVPYVAAGPKSAKLLKNGTLITYKDFPHGMPTTQAEKINADLRYADESHLSQLNLPLRLTQLASPNPSAHRPLQKPRVGLWQMRTPLKDVCVPYTRTPCCPS